MKRKLLIAISVLALCCVTFAFVSQDNAAAQTRSADDGYYTFYSEFGSAPFFERDGYLYSPGTAENKAIINESAGLETFTIAADFYVVGQYNPLNAGFYIYANDASGRIDGISAYNLQLERDAWGDAVMLRVHRFEQGYRGMLTEVRLAYKGERVNMKAVVDRGNVKVYVYESIDPVLDYELPSYRPGSVGLRCFRGTSVKIGNVILDAKRLNVDTSALEALIEKAQAVTEERYTEKTYARLAAAMENAARALTLGRFEVAAAETLLGSALDGLLEKHSLEELEELIARAEQIVAAENKYTKNTAASLESVVARAKRISSAEDIENIAYFYDLINVAESRLIAYAL